MNRRLLAGVVAVGILLVVGGCRGLASPASPTATATTGLVVVVLSASQPTGRVAQPRAPDATVARITVTAVTNGTGQGLVLMVALEDHATPAHHVAIGTVSTYPPSQPGVFTLVLPAAAADLARQGSTEVTMTVAPALAGTTLQPDVSVSLTATLARP